MLFIISFLVAILILLISIYFIYGRIMSKKETISDTKHPTKSFPVELNVPSQKKNKNKRKSHKPVSQEFGVMKTPEEIVNVANESVLENFQNQESIIEPTINVHQETGNTDVENLFSNNESDIDALQIQINKYAAEIKSLNLKTEKPCGIVEKSHVDFLTKIIEFKEELAERNAQHAEFLQKVTLLTDYLENAEKQLQAKQERLESIQNENNDTKMKLTELEQFKQKIEEKLKIVEKSHQISLSKIVSLEEKLVENNSENFALKQNVNNLSKKLENTERELKFEQAKSKSILDEKNDLVQKYEKIKTKEEIVNQFIDRINQS